MKKIAMIAHGPGTANTLYPLISSLKKDYEVDLFPFHPYASKLWKSDMCLLDEFEDIFDENYDLIITGTGSLHEVEKRTPLMAKEKSIPVLSILDLWGNYEKRFENEPDYIICLDHFSKLDIVSLGISPSKVFALGNPHFDRLLPYIKNYEAKAPYNVVFFSQPANKAKEAFYYLLKTKDKHPKLFGDIYVTAHPREDETWLRDVCKKEQNVFFKSHHDSFDLLLTSDVSFGVSSTLQFEGEIIGKSNVFYRNATQIEEDFLKIPYSNKGAFNFESDEFNATEKCLSFIQDLLN